MPIVLQPPTGDQIPLSTRLGRLGQSRRRVAFTATAFTLISVAVAGTLAVCSLDAWLHLSPFARAVGLVAVLTAGGVLGLRLIAALRLPFEPLAVALELEKRYPRLNDSLASAVSFLTDGNSDDRGVSTRFRTAAVRKAERLAERHDFARLVPFGHCWRAFWACLAALTLAAPLALWDTGRTQTALTRLGDPYGAHPWPAKTRIEIIAPKQLPARVPKGDAFELQFVVRGVVPDRAAVTFRMAGGEEFEEVYPLAKVDPKSPGALPPGVAANGPLAVVAARLDSNRLSHDFAFRVRANDADTDWQPVAVVPPPRLVPLDGRPSPQVRVVPPLYTGLPTVELPDGAGVIEVPIGTTVSLRAATDVRLSGAVLTFLGDRSAVERAVGLTAVGQFNPVAAVGARLLAEEIGADVPMAVSGDGKTLGVTLTPSVSGTYALKLVDETGLVGTRLLDIRLLPDPAPTVSLLHPAPGRDPPVLVPSASLAVEVVAEDKVYALRREFLEYRIGAGGAIHTIAITDLRSFAQVLPAVAGGPTAVARPQPTRYEAKFTLPLSRFLRDDGTPVRDGDVIALRAAADDWDDVSVLKGPGRSGEVEIRVASREAVDAFLQKELASLRPELLRARDQQRDATQKAASVQPQADGTLTPGDREKLLAAEHAQRQVRGKVGDPRDGLRAKAEMLRELARVNNLPASNTTRRVEAVADELGRMVERDLAAIEPLLGDSRQQSLHPPKSGQEPPAPGLLTRARRHQSAVEEGLTNLLALLSQWGGAGEVRGDARMLRDTVRREAGNTDKMSERVPPGRVPETLNEDQRAELDRSAGKLEQLSDQAGGLLGRAASLAAEKDKQAAEARAAAKTKEGEASDLQGKANRLPLGSAQRKELAAKAEALKAEAGELRAQGEKAAAEAEAIRKAVQAAGGQAIPDDLRKAAESMRANRQGEAANMERSAAGRLDQLANGLTEKPADSVPELTKSKKRAADQFDSLAGAQDELRKRAAEASRIPDAEKRAAELKRLAPEQQKLIDQTRELVQKLTRDHADESAKDAHAALDKMEAARDDLERGIPPTQGQQDATNKLDDARDKLDNSGTKAQQELADEARRKLADQVKVLLDRQKAAVEEAKRIQDKVVKDKKWSRPLLASYGDLEDRERALAVEIRALADREFSELPVFARVVKDAADATTKAADKAKARRQDALDADPDAAFDPELESANDGRVRRPMDLSVRRLEQVLDALKPDDPKARKDREPKAEAAPTDQPAPPQEKAGGSTDVIPPLAQLKALRSLQAELNQRTNEFAKSHPNADQLTDEDRDELKELEDAQREITALFEQTAKLFQKQAAPPDEAPTPNNPAEGKP